MTRSDFMASLRSALAALSDLELVLTPRWFAPLQPSAEFRRLALSGEVMYSELFRVGLRNHDYNIVLRDFSYFQFFYAGAPPEYGLRYAYYPNPFRTISPEEFARTYELDPWDSGTSELYMQWLNEQEEDCSVGPIRYDLAFADYREYEHPAAHLHFGIGETGRWPVARILSPEAFSLLMSKRYYAPVWSARCTIDRDEGHDPARLEVRLGNACAACAPIGTDHFSSGERRQLHLT